ncbi:hypothetical protein [Kaistia adipata]|uniref:hypothetical protein n=1 Tax=Kaistia adipata TaxID=166954 RepID=UPI0004113E2B|nr:hypothetical protein [Kaistia adipata]
MAEERKEDITIRLALAALDTEDVDPAELEALLREAITTIETLRVLVGIREEIELEDIEPEGNV